METNGNVIHVSIEDEIKESYLNYAMSVIVSRALPDVRDGLKPVHRRILYAMAEMGLRADGAYKKCGRIVGDVLGKYHPHGDQSIYDALVRLAQEFSLRYPVVNGQGNFGSVDGDPPAAMRYTEAKMQKITGEILRDIKKETVDFVPNYDDSMQEPQVLPGAFPFLLTNGASGIAVGMATNMPPQNLTEVADSIIAVIDNPNISIEEIMKYIKGPDFPTGGIIFGKTGIKEAYKTGKGKITVRAKIVLESTKTGRDVIIVTEIPYTVNKANLIVKTADLIRNGKIKGIADLRDESDRDGMRIVIELKRGAIPKIILNSLFTHTAMQQNYNVNNLALVNGIPKLLNLKEEISCYIEHRKEIVTRRTIFDLKKAKERAHILEGLKIALENIDEVIKTIKGSKDVDQAKIKLMERFRFTEKQVQAILDMRLQKLTSLETRKIMEELEEIKTLIAQLEMLLSDEKKIFTVIKEEIKEISEKYGDERRTEIIPDEIEKINIEDLISKENMVVLLSNRGFIKRIPVSAYKSQGRGGKGSLSAKLKDEDFIKHLFIATTHDHIVFVTSEGKAYWLKVHEIPEGSRNTRGTQLKGLISISADEEITNVISVENFTDDKYILMATRRGIVKKVPITNFYNAKTRGIIAIKLDSGDKLVSSLLTTGKEDVMLVLKRGNSLRCSEESIRPMGRATRGVLGIRISNDDELTGVLAVKDDEQMLLVSECGYGKRIEYDKFNRHGRATRGQIGYRVLEKTGELIGTLSVKNDDELVCITSRGNTIRLKIKDIPILGKTAAGVRIVNINKPDILIGVARVARDKNDFTE